MLAGQAGQSMVEYMLVVAAVVVVLILALGPGGFVTRGVGRAINILMVNNIIAPSPGPGSGCGTNCASNCTGNGFPNAEPCPGDEDGAGGTRVLVGTCTPGTWCEWTCISPAYVFYGGACCPDTCPAASCGSQTVCGAMVYCGDCCGNGAIDAGETCDGDNLNGLGCRDITVTATGQGQNCDARVGFPFDDGTLACDMDNADDDGTDACLAYDVSSCCCSVNGTWGGPWVDDPGRPCGVAGSATTGTGCTKVQIQNTCVGASCRGGCTGPFPEQTVTCSLATTGEACCPNGTCEGGVNPETNCSCPEDCAGICCPDGTCQTGGVTPETCASCYSDCEYAIPCCGDGWCFEGEETCAECPNDDCATVWRWMKDGDDEWYYADDCDCGDYCCDNERQPTCYGNWTEDSVDCIPPGIPGISPTYPGGYCWELLENGPGVNPWPKCCESCWAGCCNGCMERYNRWQRWRCDCRG